MYPEGPLPLIAEKFAQAPPPFVSHLRRVVGIGNTVFLLSKPVEVEMRVFPSHDFLDHTMEAGESDRAWDHEAPPDRWQYIPQRDPELESRRRLDATPQEALLGDTAPLRKWAPSERASSRAPLLHSFYPAGSFNPISVTRILLECQIQFVCPLGALTSSWTSAGFGVSVKK